MKGFILAAMIAPLFAPGARASGCGEWAQSRSNQGLLDAEVLSEASGIEASRAHANLLYHVNDSGDGPYVYLTDLAGRLKGSVQIKSYAPRDTEDLSTGRCPVGGGDCLFIADIGDNKLSRESFRILAVQERDLLGKSASPVHELKATYPDGPHNAEGMAVHPSGDAFIATKEEGRTRIYRLTRAQMGMRKATAELVAEIDFSHVDDSLSESLATGMDIAPDGKSFVLLTYDDLIEFPIDLADGHALGDIGAMGRALGAKKLAKQEAVAYLDADSLIYSTEAKDGGSDGAPLMGMRCRH